MTRRVPLVVAALGTTQTLAWASSYYLPAILGASIAAALGISTSVFFGVFSASLLLSAGLSLAAFASLLLLHPRPAPAPAASASD